MEAGKGLSCQSVRSLVAPSSRFSVKNGLPLAPLTSNNCAHKCGPRLWGVSAAEGLPQTHPAPSAAVCGPTRQEQRARGRDSSSSKEARTTASPSSRQPPQRRRSSPPESDQKPTRAGGDGGRGRDWLGTGYKRPRRAPAAAGVGPRVSSGAVDKDDAQRPHPTWQPPACTSARVFIKCRVLGPDAWTPP